MTPCVGDCDYTQPTVIPSYTIYMHQSPCNIKIVKWELSQSVVEKLGQSVNNPIKINLRCCNLYHLLVKMTSFSAKCISNTLTHTAYSLNKALCMLVLLLLIASKDIGRVWNMLSSMLFHRSKDLGSVHNQMQHSFLLLLLFFFAFFFHLLPYTRVNCQLVMK